MVTIFISKLLFFFMLGYSNATIAAEEGKLLIKKTNDFEIDGTGAAEEWQNVSWVDLPVRNGSSLPLKTRTKVLYSETGIYFLFECEDEIITATHTEDFANLFEEDVIEVFLWPDEEHPVYFEYELSPLDFELPLLVPNFRDNKFYGWIPWHYENERRTRHATSVKGGSRKPYSKIEQWIGEFFIPYALLTPLDNIPPQKGTEWRANMYRIDYDGGDIKIWQWQLIDGSFHQYKKFGTFIFD